MCICYVGREETSEVSAGTQIHISNNFSAERCFRDESSLTIQGTGIILAALAMRNAYTFHHFSCLLGSEGSW